MDNFSVQAAIQLDSRPIWEIRNHPNVRGKSIHSDTIEWAAHDRWFQKQYFSGQSNLCYVLKDADAVIGYCRFDETVYKTFKVSIAIMPGYQGRGLGKFLLGESLGLAGNEKFFVGQVRITNQASLKTLQGSGFKLLKTDNEYYYLQKE